MRSSNLRDHAQQVGAVGRALSVAFGRHLEMHLEVLTVPMIFFQPIQYSSVMSTWNHTMNFWSNLLVDDPASHHDVIDYMVMTRGHGPGL